MTSNYFSLLSIVFLLTLFAFSTSEVNAQYLPVGPQTNVPIDTVLNGGWTECYIDTYDNHMNAEDVLDQCPGNLLMLACRQVGSDTLMLLAQGLRSDVTFNTGANEDVTHIANEVGWYFNIGPIDVVDPGINSWGFVRAGDSVEKDNCDTDDSGAVNERLCWHIQRTNGGYRCGSVRSLNSGPDAESYERIVYVSDQEPSSPAQVPTLSVWGLIAFASFLGIVGFIVMRRRKVLA